jgi:hypothetical protein
MQFLEKGENKMPWVRYIPKDMETNPKNNPSTKNPRVKIVGGSSGDCMNTPVTINALRTGAIIKVPVILAELELQLSVDAEVEIPIPAREVKSLNKTIKITECTLLQDTNVLFIKGYVKKTIQYTFSPVSYYQGLFENVRQCNVEIPFGCTTKVTFNGLDPLVPIPKNSTEYEYNVKQDHEYKGISDEITIKSKISSQFYNEAPFCELVGSRIVEYEGISNCNPNNLTKDGLIKSIEEKMVIQLTIKILQNCQVALPPLALCAVLDRDTENKN